MMNPQKVRTRRSTSRVRPACKFCDGKKCHPSRFAAENVLAEQFYKGHENLNVYECPSRPGVWHVGHVRRTDLNKQAKTTHKKERHV